MVSFESEPLQPKVFKLKGCSVRNNRNMDLLDQYISYGRGMLRRGTAGTFDWRNVREIEAGLVLALRIGDGDAVVASLPASLLLLPSLPVPL